MDDRDPDAPPFRSLHLPPNCRSLRADCKREREQAIGEAIASPIREPSGRPREPIRTRCQRFGGRKAGAVGRWPQPIPR